MQNLWCMLLALLAAVLGWVSEARVACVHVCQSCVVCEGRELLLLYNWYFPSLACSSKDLPAISFPLPGHLFIWADVWFRLAWSVVAAPVRAGA